ncbi:MAG: hypothetical protein IJS23_02900 [Clostridia bacterium]|nr:hypothetical protein [Clostridia bacterium]
MADSGADAIRSKAAIRIVAGEHDVRVDRAVFDSDMMEPMYAYALYLLGGYYQMFDGRSESQVDVTVNFIDDSNGQVFQSGNYQQAMQQMNSFSF